MCAEVFVELATAICVYSVSNLLKLQFIMQMLNESQFLFLLSGNRIKSQIHPAYTASPTYLTAAAAKAPFQPDSPTTNTNLSTFTGV